jgi:hypothetical protein
MCDWKFGGVNSGGPVVVFLHRGDVPEQLSLGGDAAIYGDFRFLPYSLPRIPAREHLDSPTWSRG